PQDSQTKQEPAGRMRTPQVEQYGASTAAMPGGNAGANGAGAGAGAPEVGGRGSAWAGAGAPAATGSAMAGSAVPLTSAVRSAVVLIPRAWRVSTSRESIASRRARDWTRGRGVWT